MAHALPVLWRQYVTELRVNRKLATKSVTTYETGWNSLMATARLMGWRLRTTEDITYDRLIEWQACVDRGVDIRVIAEALGHESLESTRIYTQVSFERTRALAQLFDSPTRVIPLSKSKYSGQNAQQDQMDSGR